MVVYCTVNLINGKKYIGSDSNNNPNYYGSGVNLRKAIKKYGKDNFQKQIICEVDNVGLMRELEEYWINYFNAYQNPLFYNATKYAAGITCFPESKKINISKANKGNKYNLGRKQTQYQKTQTSKANTGKMHTLEYKDNKRKKAIGNQWALGNKFTKEQKQKIIIGKSKPILQYNLDGNFIKEWESATQAAKYLGAYDSSHISNCLNNKKDKAYGFLWKFK